MKNEDVELILKKFAKTAGLLWKKGWAEANAGNMSLRVDLVNDQIYRGFQLGEEQVFPAPLASLAGQVITVTGAGTRMRDVWKKPETTVCLLKINDYGSGYRKFFNRDTNRNMQPTSELVSHLAIHNMLSGSNRPERAIVHTHPGNLIAITHIREFCDQETINQMLWSIQPETVVLANDGVAFIPYQLTGTAELANATTEALQQHRAVLWEKHGCLATGPTLGKAFDLIDVLEKSASIFFTCKNAGFHAEGISASEIQRLRQHFGI